MAGSPGEHPASVRLGPDDGYTRYTRAGMMPQMEVRSWTTGDPDEYVTDPRPWGIVLGKRGSRGMSRAYAKSMDLLDVLRSASRRSGGDGSYAKAITAYEVVVKQAGLWGGGTPAADIIPDLFVSLDHMAHTRLRNGFNRVTPAVVEHGRVIHPERVTSISPPDGFQSAACRWVGIDVDDILIPWTAVEGESDACDAFPIADQRGIGSAGDAVLEIAAKAVQAQVERHPLFTGRVGLVRTGPRGVQVVAELELTRWETRDLWRDADFKALVQNLADRVLAALQAVGCDGGHVDPSAMAMGRYFRRPGWRVAKDGSLFRARLIFSSP